MCHDIGVSVSEHDHLKSARGDFDVTPKVCLFGEKHLVNSPEMPVERLISSSALPENDGRAFADEGQKSVKNVFIDKLLSGSLFSAHSSRIIVQADDLRCCTQLISGTVTMIQIERAMNEPAIELNRTGFAGDRLV